jgi:aspartate ammonia-lyase
LHLAIGNIPATHIDNIEQHIQAAFSRCDFANKQLCVKHVSNSAGWLGYITKQVGYTDNDALDIVSSTIPASIQQSICTESRLLTA